jgi:hypothetical protein
VSEWQTALICTFSGLVSGHLLPLLPRRHTMISLSPIQKFERANVANFTASRKDQVND